MPGLWTIRTHFRKLWSTQQLGLLAKALYISWKIYLAKSHKQQQEILTDQKINKLESQYHDMSLDNFDEEEMVFTDDDNEEGNSQDFPQGDY